MRESEKMKKNKNKEYDTLLPADSLAIVHVESEGEKEAPPAIWVTGHRQ